MKLQSENVGGLISMVGSALFLFSGDVSGLVITGSFFGAEIIFAKWGHLRGGYSLACLLLAFGDALASIANVSAGNVIFQYLLLAMAGTWVIGAARWPVYQFLPSVGDKLQPISGGLTLALRIPGIIAAFVGGNFLGMAAVTCWAIADVLIGRLQQFWRK